MTDFPQGPPDRAGLFLDFDGTLAPIVDDPTTSGMDAALGPVLRDLAATLGLVAVVSGRPAAFLADRVRADGVLRLGLYGLEEWVDAAARPRPEAERWREAVDRARDLLREALAGSPVPGLRLEDKGLAVAVHWRGAPDEDLAAAETAALVAEVGEATGLAREPGKLVEELRPPIDWDKGATVRSLAAERRLAEVCYVGDDRGDLAAFAAVRELGGVAVAVDHGRETPPELLEQADAVVTGAEGVGRWLTAMRDRLAPRPPGAAPPAGR